MADMSSGDIEQGSIDEESIFECQAIRKVAGHSRDSLDAGKCSGQVGIDSDADQNDDIHDEESTETRSHGMNNENAACPVCLDRYTRKDGLPKSPIQVDRCGHICCRECMQEYCLYHVGIHHVPVPCFMAGAPKKKLGDSKNRGCEQFLTPGLVEDILSSGDTFSAREKFRRLHQLSEDPSLVSCTRCAELVAPPISPGMKSDSRRRSCPSCQHSFCSEHGDAHPDTSCEEYQQFEESDSALQNLTKPCSRCGARLQKYSGCDHVVCPACHQDMCYKCGTHTFLTGKATRYCSQCKQGYLDHRYVWRIRLYYCATIPLVLPAFVLYVACAIIFSAISMCCFGGFLCGALLGDDDELDPKRGIAYVGMIIGLPIVLMMYDIGYQGVYVEDFIYWFMDENKDNGVSNELAEIPTLSITSSSDEPAA